MRNWIPGLIFLLFSIPTYGQVNSNFFGKVKYNFSIEALANDENTATGVQFGLWYYGTNKLSFGSSVRWTDFNGQIDVSLLSPGIGGIYVVPLFQSFKIHGSTDFYYSIPFYGKNSTDPILSVLESNASLAFSPQLGFVFSTKRSVDLKLSFGYFRQNLKVLYHNIWMQEQETKMEYKRYRIVLGIEF